MNGWWLAVGTLLVAAFFVHVVRGNRFYTSARPADRSAAGYEAWLMGRCGVQMISVDLALAAGFALLLGCGAVPRNALLEGYLLLTFGGWCLFWLVSLACEKASAARYRRLCHWLLFLLLAVLAGFGLRS